MQNSPSANTARYGAVNQQLLLLKKQFEEDKLNTKLFLIREMNIKINELKEEMAQKTKYMINETVDMLYLKMFNHLSNNMANIYKVQCSSGMKIVMDQNGQNLEPIFPNDTTNNAQMSSGPPNVTIANTMEPTQSQRSHCHVSLCF